MQLINPSFRFLYMVGVCAFLFMLVFYAVPMNLAIFMEEMGIGGSALAGLAISLITLTGFLGGMLFGRIRKVTATFFPLLTLALMAVGFFILSQASSQVHVLSATAVIGLGLGWSLPTIYVGATNAGDDGRGVQIMAVVSTLAYLGQFMSPVVFGVVGSISGNTSIHFVFYLGAVCFTVFFFGMLAKRLIGKGKFFFLNKQNKISRTE